MTYDVVIVGGGHNGLTAAGYLAKAGKKVLLLERLNKFGGAAVSEKSFSGIDAKLSRYSYLVSLLPKQIIDELGLQIQLAKRRYSSYTPLPKTASGLLVDNQDQLATKASFAAIGAASDATSWQDFYSKTQILAQLLFPTVTKKLLSRSQLKAQLLEKPRGSKIWQDFIEKPVAELIENSFQSDLVRGVVLTDGLIGTFGANGDPKLNVNKCFLYHVIGNETGDWDIPIGGMGQLTDQLKKAAIGFGAKLISDAEVLSISDSGEVSYQQSGGPVSAIARLVLANVSPQELAKLTGEPHILPQLNPLPGSQVKVNLLLKRLPKLKDPAVDPKAAFGGTFHINEGYQQLQAAFEMASNGEIPNPLPCEIYCHSLTDPSILSTELSESGAQTLTVFALHTPHQLLLDKDHDLMREKLQQAVIDSLNSVLAEPIEQLIMQDQNGRPCIETKTTLDLEQDLRLPQGNIFHVGLEWPFAEDAEPLDTPARAWGVATNLPRVLICGSGARRGGAVSGIAGHNAAMAALEMLS